MRNLWRTTTSLFWQYPILWLPVAVADLAAFCVNLLQRMLTHQIVLWVYESHSVLSSAPDYSEQGSKMMHAVLLAAPLTWGTYFLTISLYTAAMLTIAGILKNLNDTEDVSFAASVSFLQTSFRRMLKFSLKLLALCGLAAIVFAFPVTAMTLRFGPAGFLTNNTYVFGILFSCGLAIIYVIAPDAIRLIQPEDCNAIQPEPARLARISASITILASGSIGMFILHARLSLWSSWQDHAGIIQPVIDAVGSLIISAPYIPLFIAFYLIANPKSPLAIQPDASEVDDTPLKKDELS